MNDDRTDWLTPADTAARVGMTLDTLRYYEREGVLRDIARADSGHRRYSPEDVEWLDVVQCLRTTGMSIRDVRSYADLVAAGPDTYHQRLDALVAHRTAVVDRIRELTDALGVIDSKIAVYRRLDEGTHT